MLMMNSFDSNRKAICGMYVCAKFLAAGCPKDGNSLNSACGYAVLKRLVEITDNPLKDIQVDKNFMTKSLTQKDEIVLEKALSSLVLPYLHLRVALRHITLNFTSPTY